MDIVLLVDDSIRAGSDLIKWTPRKGIIMSLVLRLILCLPILSLLFVKTGSIAAQLPYPFHSQIQVASQNSRYNGLVTDFLSGDLLITNNTNFGQVHILAGSTVLGYVQAVNSSDHPVKVISAAITGSDAFIVKTEWPLPLTIEPEGRVGWNLQFLPHRVQGAGVYTGTFKIEIDTQDESYTVPLTAEVVDFPLGPWDWQYVGSPIETGEIGSILVDPTDDELWYVWGSFDGLYVTRDGGRTWEHTLSGIGIGGGSVQIDPNDQNNIFVGGHDKTLYLSQDKGESWTEVHTFEKYISSINVSKTPGTIYVAPGNWEDDNPGIYRSLDYGASWDFHSFNIGKPYIICWVIEEDPIDGTLYIATEQAIRPIDYDPLLLRSMDGGISWQEISGTLPWHGQNLHVDPIDQTVYFLTEGMGLYKSLDHGNSWEFLSNYFWLGLLGDERYTNRVYGGNHIAFYSRGGAFVSTNGGAAFEFIGLEGMPVSDLVLDITSTKLFVAAYTVGVLTTTVPIMATNEAPVRAYLETPRNRANTSLDLVALRWNDTPYADAYQLQVSLHSGFETTLIDASDIEVTSFQISDLNANTRYFWRVRSMNDYGSGEWSPVWTFTTRSMLYLPALFEQ